MQEQKLWLVSLILFVRPMMLGLTSGFAGKTMKMRNRSARGWVLLAGALCILFSCVVFVFCSVDMPLWLVGITVAIQVRSSRVLQGILRFHGMFREQGCGLGISSPVSMTIITQRVPDEHLSAVSALVSLLMSIASTVGQAMMLAACDLFGGSHSVDAYRVRSSEIVFFAN